MLQILRRLLLCFASLLVCIGLPAAAREAASQPDPVRPALWQVRDRDTTIWLFGTIHALPAGVNWFDGKVANAFGKSRELVTEVVDTDPARMQAIVASRAVLPPGQSLRDSLSAEQRAAYEAAVSGMKLPLNAFDRFEPWFAAIALSTGPVMREGYGAEYGVETILDSRAKMARKPHSALETAEYQLSLFDGLTPDQQKRYLVEVIRELPRIKGKLADMVVAWKRGDADALARIMNEGTDDPELTEKLLINRNRNWANWVRERMRRPGRVFVAVGAGHLAGPGSLQEQLTAAGLTVTRVQ